MPKAEAAIRAAAEEAAAKDAAAEKESVLDKLRAPLPEQTAPKAQKKTKVKEPER